VNKAVAKKHKEILVETGFPIRSMASKDTPEFGRGSPALFLSLIHLYPSTLILFYLSFLSSGIETLRAVITRGESSKHFLPSPGRNKEPRGAH